MPGYIYVRNHISYDTFNVCKLGKTLNLYKRDSQYSTCEIKRGNFYPVFEVEESKLDVLECNLHNYFEDKNVKYDAGKEFYDKSIIDEIELYFKEKDVKYKLLSLSEINDLLNEYKCLSSTNYSPREYQSKIINNSVEYFKHNNKGLLVLMCGVGKTLISLWISKLLNVRKLIIGVPNILLLEQWNKVVREIYKDVPCLQIMNGTTCENIKNFIYKNKNECIILTTYSSSFKIYKIMSNTRYTFDMKINDEVHHLTSVNKEGEENKMFINMLKIRSVKQLSLTATLKLLENKDNEVEEDIIISNDNKEHFGEIIEKRSLLWAINKGILCDYVIQTVVSDIEEMNDFLEKYNIIDKYNKRLFLSAYTSLKSISDNHSHHLLIYCNSKENSVKIIEYIDIMINSNIFNFNLKSLYYSNYHSDIPSSKQKKILKNFEKTKYGIITCVYCLGEGWDFPLLDGVVFAETMSSNIRIVQSALRSGRKDKNSENKINKIILPMLKTKDNTDIKKIKEVIYQLALEDEMILQKIKVYNLKVKEYEKSSDVSQCISSVINIEEYDTDLTNNLKLLTINRNMFLVTYEKAKKIVFEYKVKSKKEYYELCNRNIRLSKEPELLFKEKWKDWIDYLGIDKSEYYSKEDCMHNINKYMNSNIELKKYTINTSKLLEELNKIDGKFPPVDIFLEYYKIQDLEELIKIKSIIKKKTKSEILN
jgi:predicted helicase